ncbi:MAG: hypothetical protein R8M14_02310 [Ghiorsea sp.]
MNRQISMMGLFWFSILFFRLAQLTLHLVKRALKKTCSYLNSTNMITQGWIHYYSNEYGCSSSYKQFATDSPLKNNIAYYVKGNKKNAQKLKLVVNVNNKAEQKYAHNEMLQTATLLVHKSIGAKLPKDIQNAIKKGFKAEVNTGENKIKLLRIDWPTGKGYKLQLYIE